MTIQTWLTALALSGSAVAAHAGARLIPTVYEAGHFYAVPTTGAGGTLRLIVDTGGGGKAGMYWLSRSTAHRLQLRPGHCTYDGHDLPVVGLPHFRKGFGLPPPLGPCANVLVVDDAAAHGTEGQLGAPYLAGRIWTFDYPGQRLLLENADWHADGGTSHVATLGFQRNARSGQWNAYPRIVVRVDGQPLDMLLDTGATAHPTAAGERASGTPTVDGTGVTSYITTSQLERWHQAHPQWRVVAEGDDLAAPRFMARLIEVPKVEIAGWAVGPVWFTERPDLAFHGMMASMMDKAPEGAIGGNVVSHFVMTIDYPARTAYFRCARGCSKVTPPLRP